MHQPRSVVLEDLVTGLHGTPSADSKDGRHSRLGEDDACVAPTVAEEGLDAERSEPSKPSYTDRCANFRSRSADSAPAPAPAGRVRYSITSAAP